MFFINRVPILTTQSVARPRRRWLRRLSYVILGLLSAWLIAVQAGCLAMRTPDARWPEELRKKGQSLQPEFIDVPAAGRTIHAVAVASADSLPLAIMVHGSPGSADAYLPYLADTLLTRSFRIVSLDRPGFGYTSGFGRAEPSLKAQAEAVKAVADRLSPDRPVVLVGHSLGGPVIVRFAMDYPERTAMLVIVAGSVDPDLEEHPWWQAAIDPPPLRWLIPKSLWTSNREIISLEDELRAMMPRWQEVRCPVRIVQALDDRLVPAANAGFAKRMLVNSPDVRTVLLPEGDHFILWSRPDIVRQAMTDAWPAH